MKSTLWKWYYMADVFSWWWVSRAAFDHAFCCLNLSTQCSYNLFVILRLSGWNNHTSHTYPNVCVHIQRNNYDHKRFWWRYNNDTVSAMMAFAVGFPAQRTSNGKCLSKKSTGRVQHDLHQSTHAKIIAHQHNFLLVCSKMSNTFSTAIDYTFVTRLHP